MRVIVPNQKRTHLCAGAIFNICFLAEVLLLFFCFFFFWVPEITFSDFWLNLTEIFEVCLKLHTSVLVTLNNLGA